METIKILIQILGFGASAIGLFLAYKTLKANHEWNRRQFAAQLLEKWSSQSVIHRKAIEKHYPGLYDHQKDDALKVLIPEQCEEIYKSTSSNEELWNLRFHLIELLNYFEYIAVSYNNNVGDREMIEKSFKCTLIKWNHLLTHFVATVKNHRKYNPWQPFTALANFWEHGKPEGKPPADKI